MKRVSRGSILVLVLFFTNTAWAVDYPKTTGLYDALTISGVTADVLAVNDFLVVNPDVLDEANFARVRQSNIDVIVTAKVFGGVAYPGLAETLNQYNPINFALYGNLSDEWLLRNNGQLVFHDGLPVMNYDLTAENSTGVSWPEHLLEVIEQYLQPLHQSGVIQGVTVSHLWSDITWKAANTNTTDEDYREGAKFLLAGLRSLFGENNVFIEGIGNSKYFDHLNGIKIVNFPDDDYGYGATYDGNLAALEESKVSVASNGRLPYNTIAVPGSVNDETRMIWGLTAAQLWGASFVFDVVRSPYEASPIFLEYSYDMGEPLNGVDTLQAGVFAREFTNSVVFHTLGSAQVILDLPSLGHADLLDFETGLPVVQLTLGPQDGAILLRSTTVPVELVFFDAKVIEDRVELIWSTATESNNYGFEIYRKIGDANWEKIGFAPGHGTTTQPQRYEFVDQDLAVGRYAYRLKQIDFDGNFEYFDEALIEILPPQDFALGQNFPNPFNPKTTISFSLPKTTKVAVKIFDLLGRELLTLVDSELNAGVHQVAFDASDLPSGIYFFRMQTKDFATTKRLTVLK